MGTPTIQVALRLSDFYITKISFTAPDPSANFDRAISFDMEHTFRFDLKEDNQKFFIVFNLVVFNEPKDFELNFEAIAAFNTATPIDESFFESEIVQVNSPAIAFPFVRSFVTTLISNSGYQSIYLPSIIFKVKPKD